MRRESVGNRSVDQFHVTSVTFDGAADWMRILSSPQVVESADNVVRVIVDTSLAPNRTLRDVRESLSDHAMDVLLQFSNSCREELQMGGEGTFTTSRRRPLICRPR